MPEAGISQLSLSHLASITERSAMRNSEPMEVQEVDYWPTESWRPSAAEEQGVSSEVLLRSSQIINEAYQHITSVLVVRNGYVVWEEYFQGNDQNTRHPGRMD